MWTYNHCISFDELYHWGVKGMQWGQRRDRRMIVKLNKKLSRAIADGSEMNDKKTYKTVKQYERSARSVNKYMDKLAKKGIDIQLKINTNEYGRAVGKGKRYVETILNGQKVRSEF